MHKEHIHWIGRQLKARLRDDMHRLERLTTGNDLNKVLLPPLWKIVIDYWSEDERIVDMVIDQIRDGSRYAATSRRCHMTSSGCNCTREDGCVNISTDIYWKSPYRGSRFMDVILKVRIYLPIGGNVVTRWMNCDAFSTLLVLPRVNENGCDVPFEYEYLTTVGIAELRSDMYNQLY